MRCGGVGVGQGRGRLGGPLPPPRSHMHSASSLQAPLDIVPSAPPAGAPSTSEPSSQMQADPGFSVPRQELSSSDSSSSHDSDDRFDDDEERQRRAVPLPTLELPVSTAPPRTAPPCLGCAACRCSGCAVCSMLRMPFCARHCALDDGVRCGVVPCRWWLSCPAAHRGHRRPRPSATRRTRRLR